MRNIKFAALLMASICGASAKDVYHYDNYGLNSKKWNLPYSFVFDFGRNLMYDPTNEQFDMEKCSKDEGGFCYKSEIFNFAVPKSNVSVGDEWQLSNAKFKAVREMQMTVLGVVHHVFLIELFPKNNLQTVYFYSKSAGLIAFSMSENNSATAEMYWLREGKGIGVE